MLPIELYGLCDLLPAGTVQLYCEAKQTVSPNDQIEQEYYSNWETLEQEMKDEFIISQNPRFIELDLLAEHHFIRPQWKIFNGSLLHVRIYVIPFDHPNKYGRNSRQLALKDATRHLFSLLSHTNKANVAWDRPVHCVFEPFFPASENIFLAEIYSDLPSPKVSTSTFLQEVNPRLRNHYLEALTWEKPPGMKTTLYKYQRRTIASMIQRELQPGLVPDPHYIPIQGVKDSDKVFYFQPSPLKIVRDSPSKYPLPSGGILCEEMGTGKTCIILGLIMATKNHIAQPEEGDWKEPVRPILSELGLRYFPFSGFENARRVSKQKIPHGTFPSLTEILIHYVKSTPELNFMEHQPHNEILLRNHALFYRVNATKHPEELRRSSRSAEVNNTNTSWRQFYLTSATLIVVPRAIIAQWNSEINKHCDTSILRILYLEDGNKAQKIPSAPRLASDYDIVLLTAESFSHLKVNEDELIRKSYCRCPTPRISRIPDCSCKENDYSPLMQVRWKRLVVDEGHKTGSRSNYAERCQRLNAQHRWIVSGTPTPNLMGLGLGKSEPNEIIEDEDAVSPNTTPIDSCDEDNFNTTLHYPSDTTTDVSRCWTKEERSDLKILGEMLSRFFAFAPYLDLEEFSKKVVDPVTQESGPRFGSISVLQNIMALIMFRHRVEDIERELPEKLPPIEEKIVKLKFQPLAARTYNILQSLIAVNAVDSQREHQDYFFHTAARRHLRAVLENLSQTLFWKTDSEVFDIWQAIDRTKDAKETAIERKVSASDLDLICKSLCFQEEAGEDDVWTQVMFNGEHVYSVRGLSQQLRLAWSTIDPGLFGENDFWIGAEQLLAMQKIIQASPLMSEEKLADEGFEHRLLEQERQYTFSQSRKARRKLADKKHAKLLKPSHELLLNGRQNKAIPVLRDSSSETRLPDISIGKSPSSKVNYILKKVLKHAPKHKFLIFSSMPLSLQYVADALRLAQVRHLLYVSSEMSPSERQSNVVTFETNDAYRVLLVELKLGARGLNLISASRIIFCEPVWHADIESQAIKRAHRLGQKYGKIKVVTLVMEGTYEEAMVSRRRALQNQLQQQASSFELDVNMRRVLENPTFITKEYIEEDSIDIPLVKPFTNSGKKRKFLEDEEEELEPKRNITNMSLYNREVLGRRHAGIFNRARHPIVHEETTSSSTQAHINTQVPGIIVHSPANTAVGPPPPLIPTPPVHTPVSSPTDSESSDSESISSTNPEVSSSSPVVALPSSIPSQSPSPSPSPSPLTSDNVVTSPSFSPAPVQTAVLSSNNNPISDTTSSSSSKGGLSSGAVGAIVTIVVLFLAALTAFIVRKLYIRHRAFKRNTWGAGLVPALQTKRNTIYGGDEKQSYPSMQQREKSVPALPPTTTSFANNSNALTPPPPLYNSVSLTPSSPVKNIVSPTRATPKPDLAVVVRTFVPSLPDELNITTGEHVRILMAYDDGWTLCSNIRNEQGVVPLQCLQRGGMATALQLQPQSEFGYGSDQATKRLSSLVSNANGTY